MDINELLNPPAVNGDPSPAPSTSLPVSQNCSPSTQFSNENSPREANSAHSTSNGLFFPSTIIDSDSSRRVSNSSLTTYDLVTANGLPRHHEKTSTSIFSSFKENTANLRPLFTIPNFTSPQNWQNDLQNFPDTITPTGSCYSPSPSMSAYFEAHYGSERHRSSIGFESGDSLAAFATLATESPVMLEKEDEEVVDAAEVLTGGRSRMSSMSYNQQSLCQLTLDTFAHTYAVTDSSAFRPEIDTIHKVLVLKEPTPFPAQASITPRGKVEVQQPDAYRSIVKNPSDMRTISPALLSNDADTVRVKTEGESYYCLETLDLECAPSCSFERNCTTSSPLRKVVSHIFGRNKLSTRQIPRNIWVYFCRKHYQRARYRNPKGFAVMQCKLVRRQVDRLHTWGGVKDWIVKVRRREEMRLSKESGGASRPDLDSEEHFSGDECDTADKRRQSGASWLSAMTGTHKTVDDIRSLLDLIEEEVERFGSGFPDVEILPNVCEDLVVKQEVTENLSSTTGMRKSSKTKANSGSTVERSRSKKRRKGGEVAAVEDSDRITDLQTREPEAEAKAKRDISLVQGNITRKPSPSKKIASATSNLTPKKVTAKPLTTTKHKRKASKSLSPYEYQEDKTSQYTTTPGSPANTVDSCLLSYGAPTHARVSNKRPKGGFHDGKQNSLEWVEIPCTDTSSVIAKPMKSNSRGIRSNDATFPPPLLEDTLARRRRRSSIDSYPWNGLHVAQTFPTCVGDKYQTHTFPAANFHGILATPPPSASSISGRSSVEPEGDDGEYERRGRLLSIDSLHGSGSQIIVDTGKYVRDYISGFAPKRAARMPQANKAMRPPISRAFTHQSENIPRRKIATDLDKPIQYRHDNLAMATPRSFSHPDNHTQHRFSLRQAYISTTDPSYVPGRGSGHVSGHHTSALSTKNRNNNRSSPPPGPNDRKRSGSLSPIKGLANVASSHPRRRVRASSVGPTSRRKIGLAGVQMKRTQTAPMKTQLPSKDSSSTRVNSR